MDHVRIVAISQVCHEAIKTYRETQGDFSLKIWAKSTNLERLEMIGRVQNVFIFNPRIESKQEEAEFIEKQISDNIIEETLFSNIVASLTTSY